MEFLGFYNHDWESLDEAELEELGDSYFDDEEEEFLDDYDEDYNRDADYYGSEFDEDIDINEDVADNYDVDDYASDYIDAFLSVKKFVIKNAGYMES